MSPRPMARPGGRSARVQEAVHTAVRELESEVGRDALTVPLIAARAGVTPSTIYRRWGDLREVLSDVAVERLRPEAPPADHGDLATDLTTWAEHFLDEMTSPPGRAYLRDALLGDPDGTNAGQCSAYAADQVDVILARATERGERAPDVETVIDHVVSPMMYRILFRPSPLDAAYAHRLVAGLLDVARPASPQVDGEEAGEGAAPRGAGRR
ncbi:MULTISPECIES: TetR/AcrR family transcriptional regulator [unclassified Streptomyces]|uniref:TetR/AcrR family transcriptional regulator n=1 Tax=unclassified Streptomyces TaxID=2593676 RepID=UPI000C27D3CE|nr:TetR/AcrR family transcriptional regulator [Streptomyces sp. CB02959]PJN38532.1 TetR family transcriptional regulator [Streptomyces sp. CB02959]